MTNLIGKLEVGEPLDGIYTFNSNDGEQTDASTFQWSGLGENTTEKLYVIHSAGVNTVLVFTVTPENGVGITGASSQMDTRHAAGFTDLSEISGAVINADNEPIASHLDITGFLRVGSELTGSYKFNPNSSNKTNNSQLRRD